MLTTFRALKHRNFAFLLSGQTLSRIGDFLFQIALVWWVLEKTGSAVAMSAVMALTVLPMILFVLIGGVVVDRMPRGLLLFLSDMSRGFIMVIGAWLAFTDQLTLWEIYIIAILFGFADAFFMPAYTALIQQIIPQDDLPSANSINSLSMQFGRIAGPALGGIIAGFGGTAAAFALNGISYFIGAITIAPLLSTPAPERQQDNESTPRLLFADLREGFQTIMASPILWITILVAAIINITLSGPYSIGMPFLVKQQIGGGEKMLGFLYSIFPIGYAIASLVMGNFQRLRYRGIIFYICGAVAGLALGIFGLNVSIAILVIAALFNGAALEIENLVWTNLMQELVPPEKMGRVSSLDMLGSFVLLPIGYALTGWLIDKVSVQTVFIGAGSVAVILCLLTLLHPKIRNVD